MSKTRSSQKTKKVTISQLDNHTIHNKRQALKDLMKLNFDEIQFKNPAQKRFYNTISKKDDPSAPNSVEDDEFLNILNRKCSLGRTGVPRDLESAIQFLCSEKSSYLTGANLVVDGGWSVL